MSDSIEHNGKRYVEICLLELANENTRQFWDETQRLRHLLTKEEARLDKLLSLRTPYFIREEGRVRLVETDCGVMLVHGEGKDERAAIDAALATDAALKPQQQEWSDEPMRSAMLEAAKENGADI